MKYFQGHTSEFRSGAWTRGLAIAAVLALMAAPAYAADKGAAHAPAPTPKAGGHANAMTPAQKKQFEAFQKVRGELMQARGRLNKIQDAALKAHPELVKQRKAFGDLVRTTMKKNGYDSKKEFAELKSLRAKLQDKKTPQDQKRQLVEQFQGKMIKLRKAQGQALQDPKVEKARKALGEAVVAAMKKQDPDTDKLIAMVQSKEKELMKIRQAVIKQLEDAKHSQNGAHAAGKAK